MSKSYIPYSHRRHPLLSEVHGLSSNGTNYNLIDLLIYGKKTEVGTCVTIYPSAILIDFEIESLTVDINLLFSV